VVEAFLRTIPTNTPEYKSNKKLQRMVEKYVQRKYRQEQRQHQVSEFTVCSWALDLLFVIKICQ